MRKWCDTSKGQEKKMCYYLGVGDAESVSAANATQHTSRRVSCASCIGAPAFLCVAPALTCTGRPLLSLQGTAGGVKRDVSSSLTRGINAKRLCNRLKKKDGQMCELKYEQKFDPKTVRSREANGISGCIRCAAADRRRWLWMHVRARARTKHKCRAGGSHGSDSGGGVRRLQAGSSAACCCCCARSRCPKRRQTRLTASRTKRALVPRTEYPNGTTVWRHA